MQTLILIWIVMLACAASGFAQRTTTTIPGESEVRKRERESDLIAKRQRDIEHMNDKIAITYERDVLGNYVFSCRNNAFCNYVVELSFPNLENLRPDMPVPYKMDIPPGTRRMITLSVVTKGAHIHFSHRFRYFKGYLSHASVDTDYTYLLPVPPGRETHIFELKYIASEYGNAPEPKGWYALSLHVHSGDTIYAARRGRVTETRDDATLTDSNYSFAKEENYVEISHNDCTFGRYTVFRNSSLFVKPGEWVEAGQPIGIAGGEKYSGGPQIRFEVYYYLEQQLPAIGDEPPKSTYRAFVPLQFWTKDKGATHLANHSAYTSEHPAELITKEMNKKDAKKYYESHKSS